YLSHLTDIENAVHDGGKTLVIHDRFVDGAETILPGGAGFNIVRNFDDSLNINVLDDTTLVTHGPGGTVDTTTLDGCFGGGLSSHGFAFSDSLPGAAKRILTTGDPTHIVTFSYTFGAGTVVYSSIPLDFYLDVFPTSSFATVYAPNVLAYAANPNPKPNQPPVANAGGPYSVAEGTPLTLNGGGSTDDKGIVSYEWDLNYNGSTFDADLATTNPTIPHTFTDDFSGTIALRVTDAGGLTNIATASLTVTNAVPIVGALVGPDAAVAGQPVSYSATFTDPGTGDTHTASIDWGDGNTSSATVSETNGAGSASASHIYLAPGPYTIRLTVTDDNGGAAPPAPPPPDAPRAR